MPIRTAVVINLDYDHHPHDICEALWTEIRDILLSNGFQLSGRLFTHTDEPARALPLARAIMESMEAHLDYHERRFHKYIKEFYGFRCSHIVDLLTPCARDIEVSYHD